MTTLAPEVLLSDKFAEFSGKVTALHEKKKEMIAEFKKLYEQHKADVNAIDEEATGLHAEFNQWVTDQGKVPNPPKGPKPKEVG
jgi:hypothetical protein